MANLSQDQIRQLFVLVEEYISIKSVASLCERANLLVLWEERVKRAFPYETNVMVVSLREIAESKAREKSA